MECGARIGITAQLGMMDHAPVAPAVFRDVGAAHIAIEHHEVWIGGGDRRREHGASPGKAHWFPPTARPHGPPAPFTGGFGAKKLAE